MTVVGVDQVVLDRLPQILQDRDHLLMCVEEQIRTRFLRQNSFTDDAFFDPKQTFELIDKFVAMYDSCLARIEKGESLAGILQELRS